MRWSQISAPAAPQPTPDAKPGERILSVNPRRVAALLLIAGAAAPVTAAQASDRSLQATVRRNLPRIKASQLKVRDATLKLERTHSSRALIGAIESQNRDLQALERRVRRQSATTGAGRRGRSDVIRGLTLIVDSNKVLARDLARAAAHQHVSKREVAAATRTDLRGNRDLLVGAKLLRV